MAQISTRQPPAPRLVAQARAAAAGPGEPALSSNAVRQLVSDMRLGPLEPPHQSPRRPSCVRAGWASATTPSFGCDHLKGGRAPPPPVGGPSSLRSTGARRRRPGATRRAARTSPLRLSGPWAWLGPPASLSSTTVAAVVFAPLRTHVAPSSGLYPAPGPRPPLRFSGPWAPPLPAASLLGPAEPEGGAALAPRRSPHGTLPLQRPPRLSPRPPRRGRP